VKIDGGAVYVRASRLPNGDTGIDTITAEASDLAGNTATAASTCVVPSR
jgi:hypothetical protein